MSDVLINRAEHRITSDRDFQSYIASHRIQASLHEAEQWPPHSQLTM